LRKHGKALLEFSQEILYLLAVASAIGQEIRLE
jgi:hypothetical protein